MLSGGYTFTRLWGSLSGRLLVLLLCLLPLADVLFYFPSIATYRLSFLQDRVVSAQIAALALDATPDALVSPALESQLLADANVRLVAMRAGDRRDLILAQDEIPAIDATFDLRDVDLVQGVSDAVATLIASPGRRILVIDRPRRAVGDSVEVVMDEDIVRAALLSYSSRVLWMTTALALVAALALFVLLNWSLVRPVRRLTASIVAFRDRPLEIALPVMDTGRSDEIGDAQREFLRLQRELRATLVSQSRLAGLGAAVAKISHDLRNVLATALLLVDRLVEIEDPKVQRVAPALIKAIDRALNLCLRTLRYGRAEEPPPNLTEASLADLVEETRLHLGLPAEGGIDFVNEVPPDLKVLADPEQMFRVLVNLGRNAVEAIRDRGPRPAGDRVVVTAAIDGAQVAIRVSDTGPGLTPEARAHLFEAFRGASRAGSGLGLAIGREIIQAHGGTLALVGSGPSGTQFEIRLPWRGAPARAVA